MTNSQKPSVPQQPPRYTDRGANLPPVQHKPPPMPAVKPSKPSK